MKISEIMNGPVEMVLPNLHISALEQVLKQRGFGDAPVVSVTGERIGIVSKTDLLRSFMQDPTLRKRDAEVWEIMTPDVLCAQTGDSLACVAKTMVEARVHRVLVYEGDSLVGIASTLDFLGAIAESDAEPKDSWLGDVEHADHARASRLAIHSVGCDDDVARIDITQLHPASGGEAEHLVVRTLSVEVDPGDAPVHRELADHVR